MSDNTKIEWTDATWNPITGCSVLSAGCTNCYSMRLAGGRLRHHPSRAGLTRESGGRQVWTGEVRFNEQWLNDPLRWRRPRRVFVCAHGDLFHENVPDEWIDRVFAVMALAPQHTFQVLTKRPERMRYYLAHADDEGGDFFERMVDCGGDALDGMDWPLPHVWLGVSVEDQTTAAERIPILLDTPAALRWVSAEPLLGPVDVSRWLWGCSEPCIDCPKDEDCECDWKLRRDLLERIAPGSIDWVVAGGESGPAARPSHPEWFRSLRDQCAEAGVPFLFKQWGEFAPNWNNNKNGKIPDSEWMDRMGKKIAGRTLDGVVHDAFPEESA